MKIMEAIDRYPTLTGQLLEVWESSVKATHLFLSEEEIENMYAVGYKAGYTYPKVDNKIRQNFNKEARELTKEEYKRVIDGFTKISNKNKVGA